MTTNVAVTGGKFVYLDDIESIHHIFEEKLDIDFTSDEDDDGIPDYYEEKIIDGDELEIRVIDSSAIKDNE